MPSHRQLSKCSADRPSACPHCTVVLTKAEAAGEVCPSCRGRFADAWQGKAATDACPKCQGFITHKRVECVVCAKCGELGPKGGEGIATCPKCRETYQLMELPASVCGSCGWMRIERRDVWLRWFWQIFAAFVFTGTVLLPVLEFWSPKITLWVVQTFNVRIPTFSWFILAGLGGAVSAAIATPQRRNRKLGAICGILGGLGSFGLSWSYLRLMVQFHRESLYGKEIFLTMLLGAAPAYILYDVLARHQRKSAKSQTPF